jgi:predicted SprT family Zn-dependent metalloprotease
MILGVKDLVRFGPPGKPKVEGQIIRLGAKARIRQVEAGHGEWAGTEWDVPRSPEYIEVISRAAPPPPKQPKPRRTSRPAPAPARLPSAPQIAASIATGLTEGWAISETEKLLTYWQVPPYQAEFSNALTKALGRCNYRTRTITYSRKLWLRATDEERKTVVIHEVAHAVVEHNGGRAAGTSHGRAWKLQMMKMGISNPSPYHTIDRTGLRRKRHDSIEMTCCGVPFGVTMERLRKSMGVTGETRLRCARCEGRPQFSSQEERSRFEAYMKAFNIARQPGIAPNPICGCGRH